MGEQLEGMGASEWKEAVAYLIAQGSGDGSDDAHRNETSAEQAEENEEQDNDEGDEDEDDDEEENEEQDGAKPLMRISEDAFGSMDRLFEDDEDQEDQEEEEEEEVEEEEGGWKKKNGVHVFLVVCTLFFSSGHRVPHDDEL